MTAVETDRTSPPKTLREEQRREAESLLFSEAPRRSAAQALFHGRFAADLLMPYPRLSNVEQERVDQSLGVLREFCDRELDPVAIDRHADIPSHVIDGLARLGVLGMTAPAAFGGRG
ncbi:MAG TPA: acyl-CoA dehydrogenase family protein, partial [Planctomycetaceae bacterium]|nr:acyl-CoA dehydrogenase family protein [Planctomycetaceae bacterium]